MPMSNQDCHNDHTGPSKFAIMLIVLETGQIYTVHILVLKGIDGGSGKKLDASMFFFFQMSAE